MLVKFEDYNSALVLLNEAFALHPYNQDVMAQLDQLVTVLIKAFSQSDSGLQLRQVESLLKYEALKDNKQLLELQKKLQ